jgi:hypothetical protein
MLDAALGSGENAFLDLARQATLIRKMEGNEDVPAQVYTWALVPVTDVLRVLRTLWGAGYPRVRILCLMPETAFPEEWLTFRERADRLEGAERTAFLLEELWQHSRLGAGDSEAIELLLEDGLPALRAILTRLAEQGPPAGDWGQLTQTAIGLVSPTGHLLYRFRERAVPDLLTATSSHSTLVRIKAVEALRGFRGLDPDIEEAMDRMMRLDPDKGARQAALLAFKAVRPRPVPRLQD